VLVPFLRTKGAASLGTLKLGAVSQTPSDLPPPPPSQPAPPPTQIAGQQVEPSTSVPHVPGATLQGQGAATSTNTLAVASLVTALLSPFGHIVPGIGGFGLSVIAVVTGFMARRQIRQTGEQGMWMATVGIVIGIIHLALIVIAVIVLVILIFVLGVAVFGLSHSTG